jgi:hypothetical protein
VRRGAAVLVLVLAVAAVGCIDFHPVAPGQDPVEHDRPAGVNLALDLAICPACESGSSEALRVSGGAVPGRDDAGGPRIDATVPVRVGGREIPGEETGEVVHFLHLFTGTELDGVLSADGILVEVPMLVEVLPDLAEIEWYPALGVLAWPEEIDRRAGIALPLGGRSLAGADREEWSVVVRSQNGWMLQLSRPGAPPDTLRLSPDLLPPAPDTVATVEVRINSRREAAADDASASFSFTTRGRHDFRLRDPAGD